MPQVEGGHLSGARGGVEGGGAGGGADQVLIWVVVVVKCHLCIMVYRVRVRFSLLSSVCSLRGIADVL